MFCLTWRLACESMILVPISLEIVDREFDSIHGVYHVFQLKNADISIA